MSILFKANDATTNDSSSETTIVPNFTTGDGVFINTTQRCAKFENESSCSKTSDTVDDDITKKIGITTEYIGYVAIPVFLVIGLSGNTLTIIVMLSPQFRKMSISVFLVALAFSDTTLILMLPFNKGFVRKILGVDIRALSSAGCKLFFLMFRSAKMTSSWFVVFLCLEKFVAVWFPLKTKFICTKRNAYIGLVLVYTFLFSFNGVWTFASRLSKGACIPHYPEPAYLARIFVIVGTMIYSIIPICLLMIFTPLTCYKLFQRVKLQRTLSSSSSNRVSEEVRKTSTMLLSVSIAYMILVAPIGVAHIFFYLQGLNIFEATQPGMVIYREIAQILEQLNYSINFFLYVICCKSFRDRVMLVLACKKQPTRYRNQLKSRESTIRYKNEASTENSSSRIFSTNSLDGGIVNISDRGQVHDDSQK
ncbi:hypothetical protein SNE40_002238 [Patella caerulea]|uniref:G-protein coupled receptors family 1 profile domain-containing protein n=1 Tax=Patella caerulea TaxID=87958 RepID=A0AAN8KBE8_PATCE